MEPEQEAAAFWGSAENEVYPIEQRLKLALSALAYFGNECEQMTEFMRIRTLDGEHSELDRYEEMKARKQ